MEPEKILNYQSPLQGCYEDVVKHENSYRSSRITPYTTQTSRSTGVPRRSRPPSDAENPGSSSKEPVDCPKYSDRYKTSRTLPRDLTDLFGALECKLCGVEVTSPIVAKMHYSGKQHLKNVKRFLTKWCAKTGSEMPDVEPTVSRASASTLSDYCEICDVRFITINDKLLHYSGKHHRKNERDPTNAKKRTKTLITSDLTNSFGIGTSFSSATPDERSKGHDEFVCELCDLKVVSHEQLQMHLIGKKHKQKLKNAQSNDQGVVPKKDYCDICELSFTSSEQYQSHILGKKHKKRSQEMHRSTINQLNSDKYSLACKYCPFVGNIDSHICDKSLTKIDHSSLEKKWVCNPCHNMVFDSEEEYNEHKNTRRHLLCVLNQDGDKVVEEIEHWYCFVCKKQYRSNKAYTSHMFEQKHMELCSGQASLDSKTNLFHCDVCDIVMDEIAKDHHMKDEKHLRRIVKRDTLRTLTLMANEETVTNSFYCSYCKVVSGNFVKYSEHMLGEEHMSQMIEVAKSQM